MPKNPRQRNAKISKTVWCNICMSVYVILRRAGLSQRAALFQLPSPFPSSLPISSLFLSPLPSLHPP